MTSDGGEDMGAQVGRRAALQAARSRPRTRPVREWPYRLSVMVMILAGILVTLFPVVGTWYNNYKAVQFANQNVAVERNGSSTDDRWLARARAYNTSLGTGPVADPWSGASPGDDPRYQSYSQQLNESPVMARLRIPSLAVVLAVQHGTQESVLQRGAGHMFGTSLPVGGTGTHAGIAAHRGLANITGFDGLPDMRKGDEFFIDVAGQSLGYRVSRIKVVGPSDVGRLERVAGRDEVTLITCTPYGINSHRLLVTGSRVPLAQTSTSGWSMQFHLGVQPWMRIRLGIAAVGVGVIGYVNWTWVRQDRRRARYRLSPDATSTSSGSC